MRPRPPFVLARAPAPATHLAKLGAAGGRPRTQSNAIFAAGALWGLALLAALAGCQATRPPPQLLPVEPRPAADLEALPQKQEQTVSGLLATAEQALQRYQLTTPEDGSAYSLYQEALALAPDNDRAQRGLERIVERYVKLALQAAERQRYSQGRDFLLRARRVDPAHPAIEPTAHQIDLLESARREKVRLDGTQLQARSSAVQGALEVLGRRAGQSSCRVTISARSDAEGRWIYRQLNRGAGGVRVPTQLTVASPPAVELICFGERG